MISHSTYKKLSKPFLLIVVAITMQSCFVAKDYTRPELEETDHLFRTDNLPADSLSMADISWKDLFSDSYLQQYINSPKVY